jgi:succinoglycan biosynthesis protein ExoM
LEKLRVQETNGEFSFSINVVDNDCNASAQDAVLQYIDHNISVKYSVEPRQNIALARNKVTETASGKYFAFIDDDELPENDWLLLLFHAIRRYKVAGVLGPVKPNFLETAPAWLKRSGICNRASYVTGTMFTSGELRTGNALLISELFNKGEIAFSENKGRTGGEDDDFFQRMMKKGNVFVWCEEAAVYETISPIRHKLGYYLKRALLIGGQSGREMRKNVRRYGIRLTRCIVIFIISSIILPFTILMGFHKFVKWLIRVCYNLSQIMGFCGVYFIRERSF